MITNKPADDFNKANELLRSGRNQEALEIYEKLIGIHTSGDDFDFNFIVDSYRLFSNMGTALKRLGRYPEAVKAYTLAIENGGSIKASIWQMRAEAHRNNSDIAAAIADLEKSLECDPESNVGLWNLVCYCASATDWEHFEKYLFRFNQLYPEEMSDLLGDSDLDPVRQLSRFKEIVSKL
mgnify:CR=1 FL=1